jgi:hypothetical protein
VGKYIPQIYKPSPPSVIGRKEGRGKIVEEEVGKFVGRKIRMNRGYRGRHVPMEQRRWSGTLGVKDETEIGSE